MKKLILSYWLSLRSRLSMFKLVSGILLALTMAFLFYFFSCALMEAFRLMSITPENDIWRPSVEERNFYQLVFAFISTILAQSFCMTYWLDRPRRAFEKGHRSIVMIVNGHRNLNWFFLNWIAKVVLAWFVIFASSPGSFYAFVLYPDYKGLFLLLILVLFLHPWVEMKRAFGRKTWKWMALSAFMVVVFAFGMSRISIIDYESHDKIVLNKNVYHTYDVELPETDAFEKTWYFLSKDVYVVSQKKQPESGCQIIIDNEPVDFHSFQGAIDEWRSGCCPADYSLLSCRLIIDKSVKMKDVNELRKLLADIQLFRVQYAVVPKHLEMDVRYYTFLSFSMRTPIWFKDSTQYRKALDYLRTIPNQIDVCRISSNQYMVNGLAVKQDEVKPMLKRMIEKDLDYTVCFSVGDEMPFADYMLVVTSIKEVVDELAEEYALENYSMSLNSLDYNIESEIRRMFPLCLFEKNDSLLQCP